MLPETFIELAKANPINAKLLRELAALELPQCFLAAGCLFQTVWNYRSGLDPSAMIKDYDVL